MIFRLKCDIGRICSETHGFCDRFFAFTDFGFFVQLYFRVIEAIRLSLLRKLGLHVILERFASFVFQYHIPASVSIGPGLRIYHGYSIVVHPKTIIGSNCTIYHRITIGQRYPGDSVPVIGNGVTLGCGCTVLGPVIISDGAVVPAGALVTPRTIQNVIRHRIK